MVESLLVLGVLLGVGVIGVVATNLTPSIMTEVGLWLLFVGLLTDLPTGFWYHVLLYWALAPTVPLPRS